MEKDWVDEVERIVAAMKKEGAGIGKIDTYRRPLSNFC